MFVKSALKEVDSLWCCESKASLVAFDIDGTITDTAEHLRRTDRFLQHYVKEKYPDIDWNELDEFTLSWSCLS